MTTIDPYTKSSIASEIKRSQEAAAEVARIAAEKRKAEAPDAENLRAYLDAISAIATPAMKTQRGATALNFIIGAIVGASKMVSEMEGGK